MILGSRYAITGNFDLCINCVIMSCRRATNTIGIALLTVSVTLLVIAINFFCAGVVGTKNRTHTTVS